MTLPELNDLLSDRAEEVCRELLPNGQQRGRQWFVGSVAGEKGESMIVELDGPKAGMWFDHAAGKGGDILCLVQNALNFATVGPAAKWARQFLGLPEYRREGEPEKFDPLKKALPEKNDSGTVFHRGVKAWCYHKEDGTPGFYVVRFERTNAEGRVVKDVRPLSFRPDAGEVPDRTNPKQWHWCLTGDFAKDRPLMNLHLLARRPDDTVLVVEGEKTCEAASRLFPDLVCVTWHGGATNACKSDLSLLRGRNLILWPDNDAPGRAAMDFIRAANPGSKQVVLPPELPAGWDVADEVPPGVSLAGVLASADAPPPPPDKTTKTPKAPLPASAEQWTFDRFAGKYRIRADSGEWNSITVDALRVLLRAERRLDTFNDDSGTSELERELSDQQKNSKWTYVGPLAGHRAGPVAGQNVLVTTHPNPVIAAPGDCQRLLNFLYNMLGQDDAQYWRLLHWIHLRRKAIRTGRWRAGHLLVLVGPANCGKTYVQSGILTPLFGGRSAKPYRYMSGDSPFNGDHFGAEHLIIDDDCPGRDMDSRRAFGSNTKSMLFSPEQSCHAKGRDAVSLRPIWAMSACLNNEPENLQVLPPMEESMRDKVIILCCMRRVLPLTGGRTTEFEEYASMLTELPAFAAFVDALEIPETEAEARTGLRHYQHPSVLEELCATSPETQLDELVSDVIFTGSSNGELPITSWEGTPSDLETKLIDSRRSRDARNLISNVVRLGVYLARLSVQQPDRYSFRRTKTKRLWTILRNQG
jgi:hypothetical protein